MNNLNEFNVQKGSLLISPPLTEDDFFHNSVIFLTQQTNDSVVGFIINKPIEIKINDLIEDFPNIEVKVYFGGPVATDNLYFIHRAPHKIDGSIHIISDLYWGGEFDQVKQLMYDGILSSGDIRFFLGYSGWGVDQLRDELENQSWIVDELDHSLFEWDVFKLWENRLCKKENKYKLWVNAPKDISLN
ncbi:MAG: transcriptional regulator [Bacteroidota bacterium]|nr:MAG: transcriptional regulator [Bacteroidota bacterium]